MIAITVCTGDYDAFLPHWLAGIEQAPVDDVLILDRTNSPVPLTGNPRHDSRLLKTSIFNLGSLIDHVDEVLFTDID